MPLNNQTKSLTAVKANAEIFKLVVYVSFKNDANLPS